MEPPELQCYYKDCRKNFQSKAYLITHINSCHLDTSVYRCPCCDSLFMSLEKLFSHCTFHKAKGSSQSNSSFILSSQCNCDNFEYIPPNILKLPTLPPIHEERSELAFHYKLPMTAKLYDMLSLSHTE
jgi:hypothetical protein